MKNKRNLMFTAQRRALPLPLTISLAATKPAAQNGKGDAIITTKHSYSFGGTGRLAVALAAGALALAGASGAMAATITQMYATGGTVTEAGTNRVHSFTDTAGGNFIVKTGGSVEVVIVAGGGSGGRGQTAATWGGGGGAGGVLNGNMTLSATTFPVGVGAGGLSPAAADATGNNGGNSSFNGQTAPGGGGGGGHNKNGAPGGSSGGGGGGTSNGIAGTVNFPGSPWGGLSARGNVGGARTSNGAAAAGGGGAGGAGATAAAGGAGGAGWSSSITGTAVTYARGGGTVSNASGNGAANTGNGGGGQVGSSGNGGSGIVIVSYAAPNYYYDTDGATASLAGGAGSWGDSVWSLDQTGAESTGGFSNTARTAVFNSANSSTVSVAGTQTAAGLIVNQGTVILSNGGSGNINLGGGTALVGSGATLGGNATITGNLTLAAGALFAFDPTSFLTLGTGSTFALDSSFGLASLRNTSGGAIDWSSIGNGSYTLITGGNLGDTFFSTSNITNFGVENAQVINDGRSAYFDNGSLRLVVIPEPGAALLGSLGLLALLRRRR